MNKPRNVQRGRGRKGAPAPVKDWRHLQKTIQDKPVVVASCSRCGCTVARPWGQAVACAFCSHVDPVALEYPQEEWARPRERRRHGAQE